MPGLVYTELWDKTWTDKEKQGAVLDGAAKTLPVGFVGKPADVAEAYLYAIRADYATGSLITIGTRISSLSGTCGPPSSSPVTGGTTYTNKLYRRWFSLVLIP